MIWAEEATSVILLSDFNNNLNIVLLTKFTNDLGLSLVQTICMTI